MNRDDSAARASDAPMEVMPGEAAPAEPPTANDDDELVVSSVARPDSQNEDTD